MTRAAKLQEVMKECGLLTWVLKVSNLHGTNTYGVQHLAKRLDRPDLANHDWQVEFPKAYMENLYRNHSDHNPILLRCRVLSPAARERPFRFEAAWITHEDCYAVVPNAWQRGNCNVLKGLEVWEMTLSCLTETPLGIYFEEWDGWSSVFMVFRKAWSVVPRMH
jgi:hypothetical protein